MSVKLRKIIENKLLIGKDEWCELPELKIPLIKAKVDTGAKTSAIHAFNIKKIIRRQKYFATFDMHPLQANTTLTIHCCALIIDERDIMSSNGHKEKRLIIQTDLTLGKQTWPIEISLSNRDPLKYRFLLGREALKSRVLIDPDHTHYQKKATKRKIMEIYQIDKMTDN